jgi:hypothetical protein
MISKKIFAAFTLLFLAVAPNVHAACSNATLKGTYGFSEQGFVEVTADISPARFSPFTVTGLSAFDGHGIWLGTFTTGGDPERGAFTGTYSVQADCSGTAIIQLSGGDILTFNLVVLGPAKLTAIGTDSGFDSVYSFQKIEEK